MAGNTTRRLAAGGSTTSYLSSVSFINIQCPTFALRGGCTGNIVSTQARDQRRRMEQYLALQRMLGRHVRLRKPNSWQLSRLAATVARSCRDDWPSPGMRRGRDDVMAHVAVKFAKLSGLAIIVESLHFPHRSQTALTLLSCNNDHIPGRWARNRMGYGVNLSKRTAIV